MPLTIRNAESAILMGYARHQKFIEKFMAQWTQPLQDAVMVRMWDTMDPGLKARAKEANPEAFNEVDKRIAGMRGG